MKRVISTGNQDFESMRVNNRFYVDKTAFIGEWQTKGRFFCLDMGNVNSYNTC